MIVVSAKDLEDDHEFLPLNKENLLVNLYDSHNVVNQLLENFNAFFERPSSSGSISTAFLPALRSAYHISKDNGGRFLVF